MLEAPYQSPEFGATGRYLVVLRDGTPGVVSSMFHKECGLDYLAADGLPALGGQSPFGSLLHFPKLGVALINGAPDQILIAGKLVSNIEPEGHMFLPTAKASEEVDADDEDCERDEEQVTWGLLDTGVAQSRFTGNGVKLAVLDSGINSAHPAFARMQARGEFVCQPFFDLNMDDEVGHGSHCAGILFGDGVGPDDLRFGVAHESIGHVARIFREETIPGVCGAPDGEILNAIQWAMDKGCAVVSMSFGRRPICTRPYSPAYESIARNALARGTLLVAAAGNNSVRDLEKPQIAPVHEPANCPSIMAVGAIDPCGRLLVDSNGGGRNDAGKVDICGPGANILSAYKAPTQFDRAHGTSVATPFVAAIAALYAEACGVRGKHLWKLLQQKAVPLPNERSKDIGAGLVRAPLDYNYGEPR